MAEAGGRHELNAAVCHVSTSWCALLGISRMHGDLRVYASMTGLILPAICGAHTHGVGTERGGGGEEGGGASLGKRQQ